MRRLWWLALCAALTGCSGPEESKKPEPPKKAAEAKNEIAPGVFAVNLDTSRGPVVVEVYRDWSPNGVDHFYNLVKTGYFDGNRIYRVTQRYAQFGVNGDPSLTSLWSMARIPDDKVKPHSNLKGTLTYAQEGANSRTTQLFFNLQDNKALDAQKFAPIGKVMSGMDAVDRFYSGYGDWPPRGMGPDPTKVQSEGNAYLQAHFPRLDFIRKASVQ
jgi:peptidyl-prolyl cis-trans isomerase A (cyclophilin A)